MIKSTPTVLVIGLTWPEPNATAAGVRMLQLLTLFREDGYAITLASTAGRLAEHTALQALGVEMVSITLNSSSFDDFIRALQPEIVVFDRFLTEEQFGWRVAEHCPLALRILDTEDLHSLRAAREAAHGKGIPFATEQWMEHEKTLREVASIMRCDLSLIISDFELELLQEEAKISEHLLMYLPFFSEVEKQGNAALGFGQRQDFMFIGGGKHAPNVDAILHLKKELWPQIKDQISDANLHIFGAYLPQHILTCHNPKEGFLVHGKAESVQIVMERARICLAPLRFGAGIKGKLWQAMQYGLPSVTTPIGAEGMHGTLPWNGTIAQSDAEFVEAAVALYTQTNLWEKAQKNGYRLLEERCNKSLWAPAFLQRLKTVQQHLGPHRSANLMGRLLQHQAFQSTKYLSKWIALKNKDH
jgi:O-antigen biosynthesis protein